MSGQRELIMYALSLVSHVPMHACAHMQEHGSQVVASFSVAARACVCGAPRRACAHSIPPLLVQSTFLSCVPLSTQSISPACS